MIAQMHRSTLREILAPAVMEAGIRAAVAIACMVTLSVVASTPARAALPKLDQATSAASDATVPLLTGGVLRYTGGGQLTASYADDGTSSENQQLTGLAFDSSFLMPVNYPNTPQLDRATTDVNQPAFAFTSQLARQHRDITWDNNPQSNDSCDGDLVDVAAPTMPLRALPGGAQFPVMPFQGQGANWACSNPDSPTETGTDVIKAASTAYDVLRQAASFWAPATPSQTTGWVQTVSSDPGLVQSDFCQGAPGCTVSGGFSATLSFDCALCVTDIGFQQLSDATSPSSALTDVPSAGTYDGNVVRVSATVTNKTAIALTSRVLFSDSSTQRYLTPSTSGWINPEYSFAPGQSRTVTFDWNTDGFAWEKGKPHPDRQIEAATALGAAYRSLTVLPKPVVLVHGWNSDASTWADMKAHLAAVDPDWVGYAVGDNPDWSPAMDTDPQTGRSLDANAFTLAQYVQKLRYTTGAQHVDLVGHSMGGLISRDFIDKLMGKIPLPPNNKPVADHLVMLGTPNEGSYCAVPMSNVAGLYENATPTYQLRPDFVESLFDQQVTNQRGVRFSVLAGVGYAYCVVLPVDSDTVVTPASAFWHYTDVAKIRDLHTSLPSDQAAFDSFVVPHLALDPDQVKTAAASATGQTKPATVQATAQTTPLATTAPTLPTQLALAARPALSAHGTWTGHLNVPAGTSTLALNLLAPASVALALTDPHGKTVSQNAGSSAANAPMRMIRITKPSAGRWTVHITGDATPHHVLVGVSLAGAGVTAAHLTAVRTAAGHLQIRAWLTSGSTKLHTVTMTAWVRQTPKTLAPLRLYDDGHHGDGKKDDGVYGALSPAVPAGRYLVIVRAVKSGNTRITSILSAPK